MTRTRPRRAAPSRTSCGICGPRPAGPGAGSWPPADTMRVAAVRASASGRTAPDRNVRIVTQPILCRSSGNDKGALHDVGNSVQPLVRWWIPMPSVYDRFNLVSDFELAGDQARAIGELVEGLERGDTHQVLLGVTGSGKTFTMAQTIARVNRPTLVMVHNKTLAAQLYQEFRRFFPENAVEYFVSYYDYYQPEAYVPSTDSYIEKEATINEEIDRMRLSATRSLFERRDVIIVTSVSCIYGLGSPEAYYGMLLPLERGQRIGRDQILRKLVEIQYERNDHEFARGTFRARGDIPEANAT